MTKFASLSSAKKNQVLILICATLLAGYFGVWYPIKSQDVEHSENMVSRKQNRIQTRTSGVEMPKASARKLENQLKALETQLTGVDGKLSDMSRKFVPLDTLEDLQTMRLEISQLAKISGVNVIEMGGGKRDASISIENVMRRETANRFGRPLVALKAKATYAQLLRFTYGLNDLAYSVSIVNVDIVAIKQVNAADESPSNRPTLLDVNLFIAI